MYSMDSLEYAIRGLYRSGIGENSGLSADEVEELLDGIDFHALLQAVRHHAETVFAFATQGNQPKSFNYRGAELFNQRATLQIHHLLLVLKTDILPIVQVVE